MSWRYDQLAVRRWDYFRNSYSRDVADVWRWAAGDLDRNMGEYGLWLIGVPVRSFVRNCRSPSNSRNSLNFMENKRLTTVRVVRFSQWYKQVCDVYFTTFREYIFSSFSGVEWTKKRNRQYVPSRRFEPPTQRHRGKSQNYRVHKTPTLGPIASHISLSPTALPLILAFPLHLRLRSKRRLHFTLSHQQSIHSDPPPLPLLDTRPISSSPIL